MPPATSFVADTMSPPQRSRVRQSFDQISVALAAWTSGLWDEGERGYLGSLE